MATRYVVGAEACSSITPDVPTALRAPTPHLHRDQESDSAPGTLRRTTELADPGSTITFAEDVRTITLSSELVLDKNLTIMGPEGGNVIISGNNVTRVFLVRSGVRVELRNLTITKGHSDFGGGIYNADTLTNSILALNSAPFAPDIRGNISSGNNLVGEVPGLDPMADNGGPTKTHALLPGSPAINAADSASCPATDQAGWRALKAAAATSAPISTSPSSSP